jgi:hypothetical protein
MGLESGAEKQKQESIDPESNFAGEGAGGARRRRGGK